VYLNEQLQQMAKTVVDAWNNNDSRGGELVLIMITSVTEVENKIRNYANGVFE